MSESVSDAPLPTNAPHPFNQSSADLTLRTPDRVDFHVHSHILSQASPVFADMLSLPQPSSISQGTNAAQPIVDVTEDSKTLGRLLRLCYPIGKEKLDELEDIVPVLQAAMKYDMEWPISLLTTDLRAIVPHSPLKVWAVACRCGLEALALEAASRIMKNAEGQTDSVGRKKCKCTRKRIRTSPLALLASMLKEPPHGKEILRGMSAADYFRLREYLRVGDEEATTKLLSPIIPPLPSNSINEPTLPLSSEPTFESPSPIAPIPHFPPPDVILRCPNGTEYRVHALTLVLHSPALGERIREANVSPSSELQSRANDIDSPSLSLELDIDSSTLSILLGVMYGGNSQLPSNLHLLGSTLIEAGRFGIAGIAEAAQDRWNSLATSSPLEAYFVAVEQGLTDCARFAARKALEGPVAGIYVRAMEASTALAYHHLLEYYRACASSIDGCMEAAAVQWKRDLDNITSSTTNGPQYTYASGYLVDVGIGAYLTGLASTMHTLADVPGKGCSFDLTLPALLRVSSSTWPSPPSAAQYKQLTEALTKMSVDLPQLVADAITKVELEIQ